jgi:hypothetical protein
MSKINEYFQSFENEIGNDQRAYLLNSVKASDYGFLPRPIKWLSRMKSMSFVLTVLVFFLRWFWYFGGAVIFFTVQSFREFLKFRNFSSEDSVFEDYTVFGLGFSERALEVINKNSVGHDIPCWLVLPWVQPTVNLASTSKVINMYSVMKSSDFIWAWIYSVRSIYMCLLNSERRVHVLQTYTAFRWFLIRFCLSRLRRGHLYTAEHFDRWNILADRLVLDMKRQGFTDSTLSLVQHGLLGSLTGVSDLREPLGGVQIKHKLNSVGQLYVYDQNSADIFKQQILSQAISNVEVHFFKPQIQLQKPIDSQLASCRILFVGHPVCEAFQLALVRKMTADKIPNLRLFYKPHPTNAPHQSVREQKWTVIDDKSYFPEVDLLISYPSTLVSEYAFWGIDALVHPINVSVNDVDEFYRQVRLKMNKLSL